MASSTSRVSAAGRPPLGPPDLGPVSSAWANSHCSSVRSVGYRFLFMTLPLPDPPKTGQTSFKTHSESWVC
jgi:hypothetical protein